MYIWIGQEVNATDISSIWGVNTPMEVADGPIPVKDTENNANIRNLVEILIFAFSETLWSLQNDFWTLPVRFYRSQYVIQCKKYDYGVIMVIDSYIMLKCQI